MRSGALSFLDRPTPLGGQPPQDILSAHVVERSGPSGPLTSRLMIAGPISICRLGGARSEPAQRSNPPPP
jgi:hypothetical protein